LDATDKPDKRISLLEEQLKIAQSLRDYIQKQIDRGIQASELELLQAVARCLAIEFKLLKEKQTDDSAKIAQLQNERIDALKKSVDLLKRQSEVGAGPYLDLTAFWSAARDLLAARLDAADEPQQRIAILEEQLKSFQDVRDFVKRQRDAGFLASDLDVFQAQARCLAIEIKLQKEKQPDDSAKIGQLQNEQIDAIKKSIDLMKRQYESGAGPYRDLTAFRRAEQELLAARLDATDKPSERIAVLEEQLKSAQDVRDFVKRRHDVGFEVSDLDLFQAEARCLSVEIMLLKERIKAESAAQ
jgi:outer membrane protein TolC